MVEMLTDTLQLRLNPDSGVPLYRQLASAIESSIASSRLSPGDRLPPTRELALELGLNRTTVSAAYALLEQSGLIEGHVGRGSFVARRDSTLQDSRGRGEAARTDWSTILPAVDRPSHPHSNIEINFASSQPAADAFPLSGFRELSKDVIDSPEAAQILQLGSPYGYGPLREFLMRDAAEHGIARSGDDIIVTNGCQQALDLLARLFITSDQEVVLEDPVYHGLVRVFSRTGARVIPVPVDADGLDVVALEQVLRQHRPRLLIVTPSFQNPTGATLSLPRRERLIAIAKRHGIVLVENDIYSELRYRGKALPTLKELDSTGDTILLRSYSKVSFPGLRVGWVVAPRAVVSGLAEAKQTSDLHSDQLSQAVLLRFAASGEFARHLASTRRAGALRLDAALDACSRYLPKGTRFTRPEGGMNLWIELPAPLTAESLLQRAGEQGVAFLPGRFFSSQNAHPRGLRISFGGSSVDAITRGIRILGEAASAQLAWADSPAGFAPVPAFV